MTSLHFAAVDHIAPNCVSFYGNMQTCVSGMLLILQPVDWDSQPPIRQFMKTWSFLILKSFIYRFLETHEIIFFPCWNFNHKWTIFFFFFEKAVRAQYFLKLLESFFKKIFFPKLIYFWPHCP